MVELGHDDPDDSHRMHTAVSQRLCEEVGGEVMFTGISLDGLPSLHADAGAVLEGPGDSGDGDSQLARDVLHSEWRMLVHR